MIPQDLLDILVCPVCKKPLALKNEGQSLKCAECRRVYPVRDGIPIMLVDEAVTEPSPMARAPDENARRHDDFGDDGDDDDMPMGAR